LKREKHDANQNFPEKTHGSLWKNPRKKTERARTLASEWKMFYAEGYVMFEEGLLWLNVLYAERK
jgi:hypothetical protein